MATDDEIREAVRAALDVARYNIDPTRNEHILVLASHCTDLLAEGARLRGTRCRPVTCPPAEPLGATPREITTGMLP